MTCNGTNQTQNGTGLQCKNLIIPDCVDRTVYCSDTPSSTHVDGSLTVMANPSPFYLNPKGKISIDLTQEFKKSKLQHLISYYSFE